MPLAVETRCGGAPIDLAEFTARLDEQGCDLSHEEGASRAGELLSRLHTNRTFLGDVAIAELKNACRAQDDINRYGAQVTMLHRVPGRHFVRCNFWPAADDPVVQASGERHFVYHLPHDHNFDFLTIGHIGPGYRSDWYDYDGAAVAGYPGEPAGLRLVERGQLHEGRMLHYRAHRDVHTQFAPDALSISINIVPERPAAQWFDRPVPRG